MRRNDPSQDRDQMVAIEAKALAAAMRFHAPPSMSEDDIETVQARLAIKAEA